MLKLLVHICNCFFLSKQLVQKLHLYIMNIFNVLRKVDIVFNTVVINITFVGIIILKISMFEGKMNFKGILVKFLLMNIAIKQFILKVFNFKFSFTHLYFLLENLLVTIILQNRDRIMTNYHLRFPDQCWFGIFFQIFPIIFVTKNIRAQSLPNHKDFEV